jgi:hypothetical protein
VAPAGDRGGSREERDWAMIATEKAGMKIRAVVAALGLRRRRSTTRGLKDAWA